MNKKLSTFYIMNSILYPKPGITFFIVWFVLCSLAKRKFFLGPFLSGCLPIKIKRVHIYKLFIYILTEVANLPFDLQGNNT